MSLLSHTAIHSRRKKRRVLRKDGHRTQRELFYSELFNSRPRDGADMPLDTESHWHWTNPANLIPGLVLLLLLLVGMIL